MFIANHYCPVKSSMPSLRSVVRGEGCGELDNLVLQGVLGARDSGVIDLKIRLTPVVFDRWQAKQLLSERCNVSRLCWYVSIVEFANWLVPTWLLTPGAAPPMVHVAPVMM
jgi:hypothetical protein